MIITGAVVFALTMLLARGQSVWFDEGYSILLAKHSVSELLALTAVDAHPPLYYLLLKMWGELFGFSEFALRSMSALFAAGTVTLALTLARKLFGTRVALIALPFVVIAPFILRYGYEIRMYSLVGFLGAAGTYALITARQTEKLRWWVVYAMIVALGMYTLYMSIVIWLAHAVWLVWMSVRSKQPILQWRWPLAFIGAIILFTPYVPTFIDQMAHSVLSGVGSEVTLTSLINITTLFLLFTPEQNVGGWLSLGIIMLFILLIPLLAQGWRQAKRTAYHPYIVLLLLLAGLPMLVFALLSLPPREPLFLPRYMAHVAVWVYMSMGVLAAYALIDAKKAKQALFVVIITLSVLASGVVVLAQRGNYVFDRLYKPPGQLIATDFNGSSGAGCNDQTTIAIDGPQEYIELLYYFERCDTRFVASYDPEFRGGFAPLHSSKKRITSSAELSSQYVIVMHWEDAVNMTMDDRYELIETRDYGKYRVNTYQLRRE